MSAFVLDCSVAMSWCFDDEASAETDALAEQLADEGAIVPVLWQWEVANALIVAQRRKRIDAAGVAARAAQFAMQQIQVDEESASRALRETMLIAQTEGLSAYDAAYLELAQRLGLPLATKDSQLRAAAVRLGIATLP